MGNTIKLWHCINKWQQITAFNINDIRHLNSSKWFSFALSIHIHKHKRYIKAKNANSKTSTKQEKFSKFLNLWSTRNSEYSEGTTQIKVKKNVDIYKDIAMLLGFRFYQNISPSWYYCFNFEDKSVRKFNRWDPPIRITLTTQSLFLDRKKHLI